MSDTRQSGIRPDFPGFAPFALLWSYPAMNYGTGRAPLNRQAHNDNKRPRTRADEQFMLIGILLGSMVLFVAATWLVGG